MLELVRAPAALERLRWKRELRFLNRGHGTGTRDAGRLRLG